MKRRLLARARCAWLALACCSGLALAQPSQDPWGWLEEVDGARAMAWVREQSERSAAQLGATPAQQALQRELAEVLASPQRLVSVQQIGAHLYNFWRDAEHPRGLWRRTTLASYRSAAPQWQTVLDLDRLSREDGERWVWAGADCLAPMTHRCLISLSPGGGDAHVVREFDLQRLAFITPTEGGFALPLAKGGASWLDRDTLAVASDFGPDSLTQSGYPRELRLWRRGTPLTAARRVYQGPVEDVGLWSWSEISPRAGGGVQHQLVLERRSSFFAGEQFLWRQGRLQKLDKPDDATASFVGNQLLLELRSDWRIGTQSYPAGALLAIDTERFLRGQRRFQLLFAPGEGRALLSHAVVRDGVLLVQMDRVRQQLVEWRFAKGQWREQQRRGDGLGSLSVSPLAGQFSTQYLLTHSDFLQPASLALAELGQARPERLQQLPAWFDARGLEVQQWQARSADGTQVPYFIVKPRGAAPAGGWPTLLYGYGGFEISMKPGYNAVLGRAWLARGGVYVLANLRGGGEFGPRWHQAAMREHRQRSFDDFIAIAEDLQARGITSAKRLGIMGGSLGGLLTSVALVQRPELFGAVVSQVPLTDMQRYHRMLAGASWIEEYGDPDIPEQWAYISKYSPYHNSRADQAYPPVLYTSSTRDDRVHPGHARKMVARLQSQGHEVLYWENLEGGHAGASTPAQQAQLWAYCYGFLQTQLMR